MPEFKIVSGTLDAAIQLFEQAFHITFPTHAGGSASVQQPVQAPQAAQALQAAQAPQAAAQDVHQNPFETFFPAANNQALLDLIGEQLRHAQELRSQLDAGHSLTPTFDGSHWDLI
jgi:hypothetical protein